MANSEQVALLKYDRKEWNKWREEYAEAKIDLSGADLSRTNLSEANLRGANLSKTNLKRADLRDADLYGANVNGANLNGANLSGADLTGQDLSNKDLRETIFCRADLSEANLKGADLKDVDLSEANLKGANFSEANLKGANLRGTDLSRADLSEANLSEANLFSANLSGANLSGTNLSGTNLSGANLTDQDLSNKDLRGVNLSGANLSGTNLFGQDLGHKDLSGANLSKANLSKTLLIETNLTGAILTDCNIYGIAAWNVRLENAVQKNLIITQKHEATITIDNLKVAQFIYLMLNNKEIRDVINTLTTKSVLILGRFTPERKAVLDALRDALRVHNYLPILFDFDKPSSRNFTETIRTLAHLSRFIIADLSEPRSIPQELQAIIPLLRVTVKPLLNSTEQPYNMFEDFDEQDYHWVLPIYQYTDLAHLLATLKEQVIDPAESKACELEKR